MIRRYIASLGGVLVPSVTFTGISPCTSGQQPTNFTVNSVPGTVLGLKLLMSGYFVWDNTVGSRDVTLAASIFTPAGSLAGNPISQIFNFTGQSGNQSFNLASSVLFYVTVDGTGAFAVGTNANINNAGNGYLLSSTFVVASVNGQGMATQLSICSGFSTGSSTGLSTG